MNSKQIILYKKNAPITINNMYVIRKKNTIEIFHYYTRWYMYTYCNTFTSYYLNIEITIFYYSN